MWVQYVARRSISSGHSSGSTYQLDFNASSYTKQTVHNRSVNVSLNNTRETIYNSFEKRYQVTIANIPKASLAVYEEFLDSVIGGEQFTMDLDFTATYAAQVDPQIVKITSENYNITISDGFVGNYYDISLEVAVV